MPRNVMEGFYSKSTLIEKVVKNLTHADNLQKFIDTFSRQEMTVGTTMYKLFKRVILCYFTQEDIHLQWLIISSDFK